MDKPPPPLFNLRALTENQRCRVIAETCAKFPGKGVGFIVENEESAIARYIQKVKAQNPLITVERCEALPNGSGFLLRAFQPVNGSN